ncbi:MAG: hypothetical protein IT343_12460 [Candidatus Melainabacteria bacterium]|nr:hypothetical protein [Candidatus Melainabacteria bacterium]
MTATSTVNVHNIAPRLLTCGKCSESVEAQAKFCGQCGNIMHVPAHSSSSEQKSVRCTNTTPTFAKARFDDVGPKVRAEINQIMSALFRERFILILNTFVLLGVNLVGFCLSLKAYTEFNGDEMCKLIIAFTPFLFVNGVGCVALIPIRGTKREIYRLQQRLQFLRAQMDYQHLMRG